MILWEKVYRICRGRQHWQGVTAIKVGNNLVTACADCMCDLINKFLPGLFAGCLNLGLLTPLLVYRGGIDSLFHEAEVQDVYRYRLRT